jgi:enoyl-CoA hydratase/carnithine racemase
MNPSIQPTKMRKIMTYNAILYQLDDNILTITLNRPEKLNAYTNEMQRELIDALDRADADDEVRAIIVTGAGDRAFCAGADLSAGADTFNFEKRAASSDQPTRDNIDGAIDAQGNIDWSHQGVRDGGGQLTLRIFKCLKPVIAAVNGAAVGVGVTMQLAMDIRVAADTARFGFVFSRRGMVPEACSSWFLPRIVGMPKALEWTFSGRVFDAEEALQGGLVRSLHKPQELMDVARGIAREIADNTAPVSVALSRQMLWRMSAAADPMEAHRIDSRGIFSRGRSADSAEGVSSFLEKREAHFPDKVSEDMPEYFPWWDEPEYN